MQIVVSNHLEKLASALQRHSEVGDPFVRRIVILQGPAMKAWLRRYLAEISSCQVTTGMEFVSFDQALPFLLHEWGKSVIFPSALEWGWAIEETIRTLFSEKNRDDPLWLPLTQWLSPDLSTQREERRLARFTRRLGRAFIDYGKFGGGAWEKCDGSDSEVAWQRMLWDRILLRFPQWHSPYTAVEQITFSPLERPTEIHLFSCSFLSRLEHRFFKNIASFLPVRWYLLSPCSLFWGDIASDRERHRLQAVYEEKGIVEEQQEELEAYLRDRHALLANFGRLGREMVALLEENAEGIEPLYAIPAPFFEEEDYVSRIDPMAVQECAGEMRLLDRLQADILLLRAAWQKPTVIPNESLFSVQVHAAPSLLREVEILYNNLLAIFDRERGITPSTAVVMAPDIAIYQPYIAAVFGAAKSLLPYQVIDAEMPLHNPYVKAFMRLLTLAQSRWDVNTVFSVLENPLFLRACGWTGDDICLGKRWMRQEGVRWGMDVHHRIRILEREHAIADLDSAKGATWDRAFSRLFRGLAAVGDPSAAEGISLPQAQFLGEFYEQLQQLYRDLEPLVDGTRRSIREWGTMLWEIAVRYLSPGERDRKEQEDFAELLGLFSPFFSSSLTNPCPFSSLREDLDDILQKPSLRFREGPIESVRFCSLRPMRTIPGEVIALLGMEEGSFPRQTLSFAVNRLHKGLTGDFCPTTTDGDRYLFLEALLSCRHYFILSYQGYRSSDGKPQSPSLLVQELLHEIEKGYAIEEGSLLEKIQYRHPFASHDRAYFLPETGLHNFSLDDYGLAQKRQESRERVPFFSLEPPPEFSLVWDKNRKTIDLSTLLVLARNPLQYYFSHSLDLHWEREEASEEQTEDPSLLHALDRYRVHHSAWEEPLQSALETLKGRGRFPYGIWGDLAEEALKADLQAVQEYVGGELPPFLRLHFVRHVDRPQKKGEHEWLLPAMPVSDREGHVLFVTGVVNDVTEKGLFLWSKEGFTTIARIWPKILLFAYAQQICPGLQEPSIVFLLSQKRRDLFFSNPLPYMQQWIGYMFQSEQTVSPLVPDWIELFLQWEQEALREEVQRKGEDMFYPILDPFVQKFFSFSFSASTLSTWSPVARRLYGDAYQAWYGSKRGKS